MSNGIDICDLYETEVETLEEAKKDIQKAIDHFHKKKGYKEIKEKKAKRTIMITEVPKYLTCMHVEEYLEEFFKTNKKNIVDPKIKKIERKYGQKYCAHIYVRFSDENFAKWFEEKLPQCVININYEGKIIKVPLEGGIQTDVEI